jgi:hypothetical protein
MSPAPRSMGTYEVGDSLPSRVEVRVPADIHSHTDWKSDGTFHRFDQYSDALEQIRADIAKGPIEKKGKLFGWLKLDQATRMDRLEREDDGFFVPKNS